MKDRISPAVDVTIGGQTRIYHAFITTAPIALDGPSTLTLYESCFADVAGFAADPIPFDRALGNDLRSAGADREHRAGMAARPLSRRSGTCSHRQTQSWLDQHPSALAVAAPRASRRSARCTDGAKSIRGQREPRNRGIAFEEIAP